MTSHARPLSTEFARLQCARFLASPARYALPTLGCGLALGATRVDGGDGGKSSQAAGPSQPPPLRAHSLRVKPGAAPLPGVGCVHPRGASVRPASDNAPGHVEEKPHTGLSLPHGEREPKQRQPRAPPLDPRPEVVHPCRPRFHRALPTLPQGMGKQMGIQRTSTLGLL